MVDFYGLWLVYVPIDGSYERPRKSTEESLGFEKPREDTKNPAEEPLDANTEAQVPWKNGLGRFEPKENDIKVLPKTITNSQSSTVNIAGSLKGVYICHNVWTY